MNSTLLPRLLVAGYLVARPLPRSTLPLPSPPGFPIPLPRESCSAGGPGAGTPDSASQPRGRVFRLPLPPLLPAAVGSRPQGRILAGDAWHELPQDTDIVFHCKAGTRSANVLAAARKAGYQRVSHLDGGILAWVREVEPHKPVY